MEVGRGAQKCATCEYFAGTLLNLNPEGALDWRNHLSPDWRRIWRIQVRLDGAFFGATRCSRNKKISKDWPLIQRIRMHTPDGRKPKNHS
jgi:hypothetical protein